MVTAAVIVLAVAFDVTNGFHDSANAVAALVATRAGRPGPALALAASCNFIGPVLAGTAVADTVGGVVDVPRPDVLPVVGAALSAAIGWNLLTWWRGLPASSSHGLVGGLVGACLAAAGGSAVHWGGFVTGRPTGVLGVLAGLALSPALGLCAALVVGLLGRRLLRRARRRVTGVVRAAEWPAAAWLGFSHGANDAQKTMAVITLVLLSTGHLASFTVPLWVKLVAAAAMTAGTSLGGWRIVRTVGRGIYRLRPLDGLISQAASGAVVFAAAGVGAPVSTTHVVAASVVGVGAGRRRRHVRWAVVGEMASAWLITLPACALLAAVVLPLWRAL